MTPRKYQQEALDKLAQLKHPKHPIFWQMRLGKSPTAIWAIKQYFNEDWWKRKHLFLCPKSVMVSWIQEFEKHSIHPLRFESGAYNKMVWEGMYKIGNWFITNYEAVVGRGENPSAITQFHWDSVTVDESQVLRNIDTKRSQVICDQNNFPYTKQDGKEQVRQVLSGTPNPESLLDFYQQIYFLYGRIGVYDSYWKFKDECFQMSDELGSNKLIPKPSFLQKWGKWTDKYTCTLTRTQAGVNIPNVYEKRFVELADKDRKIYNQMEAEWYTDFMKEFWKKGGTAKDFKSLEAQFIIAVQNYLHQLACGFPKRMPEYSGEHKYNELETLLMEDLRDERVVIWCRYDREIQTFADRFEAKGRRPIKLTGGMSTSVLKAALESFQKPLSERGSTDLAFCQIKKAALGMDLSSADTQIFFSRSWSNNENTQALDRLIQVGKKTDGILTIDLIAENTIDEDLYWALIDKKANATVYKLFTERTKFGGDWDKLAETTTSLSPVGAGNLEI